MMRRKLEARVIARGVLYFVLLAAFFYLLGGVDWIELWVLFALLVGYALPTGLWLRKNNPKLMKDRMFFRKSFKGWKSWDKAVQGGLGVLFIALLVVAGADRVVYGWSYVPLWVEAVGFAGVVPAFVVSFLVMRENTYLSRLSEVQEGQKVITTGPYSFVRHPMYAGFLPMFVCLPLALGSFWALVPAVPMAVRTASKSPRSYPMSISTSPCRCVLPVNWNILSNRWVPSECCSVPITRLSTRGPSLADCSLRTYPQKTR